MTVWRTGWGPTNVLLGRREEGLRKMMGFSCLFHLFLFAFMILNNAFSNPRTPALSGFQVNLVAPRFGLPGSASGGGGLAKGRSGSKKGGLKSITASTVSRTPAKHTARTKQSKKAAKGKSRQPVSSKSGPPPLSRTPAPKTIVKAKAPVARPTRKRTALAKTAPPVQKDPERLEDWWTKQKKSLKMPAATPRMKASKDSGQTTRTAKIDIKRRAVVTPPLSRPILDQSAQQKEPFRGGDLQNNVLSQSNTAEVNHSENGEESFDISEGGTHETASGLASVGPEVRGRGMGLGGDAGPGIKGVGTGTGQGGGAFFFPSYLQAVDSKIRWQWAPPPIRSHEDSLVVRFVINKNGSIDESSIVIEESSGNIFFDQAGRRAVFAARPLPPLPKAYAQDSLIIYMNFIVREDT